MALVDEGAHLMLNLVRIPLHLSALSPAGLEQRTGVHVRRNDCSSATADSDQTGRISIQNTEQAVSLEVAIAGWTRSNACAPSQAARRGRDGTLWVVGRGNGAGNGARERRAAGRCLVNRCTLDGRCSVLDGVARCSPPTKSIALRPWIGPDPSWC